MKQIKSLFTLGIALLLLSGCVNENNTSEKEESTTVDFDGKINFPNAITTSEKELKVYPLPTPLQIATVLKSFNFKYNDTILKPSKANNYSNSFKKSLNLGVNLIDLGYSTVFSKTKQSSLYFGNVNQLMSELGMDVLVNEDLVSRFQTNIENVDSLSKIILETYSLGNEHLKRNEQEGLGLLIMTGAYLEGLYILTNTPATNKIKQRTQKNLIAQHKLFLESIIELMEFYKKADVIIDLQLKLKKLQKNFEDISINYNDNRKKLETQISQSTINTIKHEVKQLRSDILK